MEKKKTKLTISGIAKQSIKNIEIAKTQGKNSVVIEKKSGKPQSKNSSFKGSENKSQTAQNFKKNISLKSKPPSKTPYITNDFERRKLA